MSNTSTTTKNMFTNKNNSTLDIKANKEVTTTTKTTNNTNKHNNHKQQKQQKQAGRKKVETQDRTHTQ